MAHAFYGNFAIGSMRITYRAEGAWYMELHVREFNCKFAKHVVMCVYIAHEVHEQCK